MRRKDYEKLITNQNMSLSSQLDGELRAFCSQLEVAIDRSINQNPHFDLIINPKRFRLDLNVYWDPEKYEKENFIHAPFQIHFDSEFLNHSSVNFLIPNKLLFSSSKTSDKIAKYLASRGWDCSFYFYHDHWRMKIFYPEDPFWFDVRFRIQNFFSNLRGKTNE